MTTDARPADDGSAGPAVADAETTAAGATPVASPDALKVANRLKRAQGQLAAVIRMVEEGRSCEDVVVQLSAVSKAIDRAGFAIIATGMEQCFVSPGTDGPVRVEKLQKLFLSLT